MPAKFLEGSTEGKRFFRRQRLRTIGTKGGDKVTATGAIEEFVGIPAMLAVEPFTTDIEGMEDTLSHDISKHSSRKCSPV